MLGAGLVEGSVFRPAPTHQLGSESNQLLYPGLIHGDKFHSLYWGSTEGQPRAPQRGGDLAGATPAHGEVSRAGGLLLALVVGLLTRGVSGAHLAASWHLADSQPAWGSDPRDTEGDRSLSLRSCAASQSPLCSHPLPPTP